MPRTRKSPTQSVLEYFQTQPVEVAAEILALCVAAVKARRGAETHVPRRRKPAESPAPSVKA